MNNIEKAFEIHKDCGFKDADIRRSFERSITTLGVIEILREIESLREQLGVVRELRNEALLKVQELLAHRKGEGVRQRQFMSSVLSEQSFVDRAMDAKRWAWVRENGMSITDIGVNIHQASDSAIDALLADQEENKQ